MHLDERLAEAKGHTRIRGLMRLELLTATLLMGCSIVLGLMAPSLVTTSIGNRDAPFPPHSILWIGFAVAAIAAGFWVRDELRRVSQQRTELNPEAKDDWGRIWATFGILMAGYLSVEYIGLVTTGAFVYAALLRLLGEKRLVYIAVTGILYPAAVYLIFEGFFDVALPRSVFMPEFPF